MSFFSAYNQVGNHRYYETGFVALPPELQISITVTADGIPGPPTPPTSVSATAALGAAAVSWSPPVPSGLVLDRYTVTAAPGGQEVTVGPDTLSTVVPGLTGGTTYTFTVTAHYTDGSSATSAPSNPVTPTAPSSGGGGGGLPPPAPPPPTPPTATLADVTVPEGAVGIVEVVLDAPADDPVAIGYHTEDGTATAPDDYAHAAEVLTIPSGSDRGAIEITTHSDQVIEGEEHFDLVLTSGDDVLLDRERVRVTISDTTPAVPTVTHVDLPSSDADHSDIAIALSRLAFPDSTRAARGTEFEVLIAAENAYADALASGTLQAGRPLLLTDPGALEPAVADELDRLGATRVRILGGEAAVTATVADQLEARGLEVVRTFGPTRLETASAIADLVDGRRPTFLARAYPAEGAIDATQAFADTLALGAWAATAEAPILLTEPTRLSTSTEAWLGGQADDVDLIAIGGHAAIAPDVVDHAADLTGREAARIEGPTRFATAVAIASARGFTPESPPATVILIEGQHENSWAAGFTAAALAASADAPILLANGQELPPETAELLATTTTADTSLVCVTTRAACEAATDLLGRGPQERGQISPVRGVPRSAGARTGPSL